MNYKGYSATADYDDKVKTFFGTVINTRDVITFEGTTVQKLEKAFHESVDDYLAFCKDSDKIPEKTFSGKFTIRISPKLHEAAHERSSQMGKSLNKFLEDSLKAQFS